MSLQNIAVSGGPQSIRIPLFFDVGEITTTINPAGFDPPELVTFDLALEAVLQVEISIEAPAAAPIDPFTLRSEFIRIIRLPFSSTLTAIVDGQPGASDRLDDVSAVDLQWWFTDAPAPGLIGGIDEVDRGLDLRFTNLSLSMIVREAFNADLVGPERSWRIDRQSRVLVDAVAIVPEPMTAWLLALGLAWIATSRGHATQPYE